MKQLYLGFALLIVALVLVLIWYLMPFRESSRPSSSITESVEHLVMLPHGVFRLSPADEALLSEMRRSPKSYLPVIKGKLILNSDLRVYTRREESGRFVRTLSLLFAVGSPEALDIAQEVQRQIADYLDQEWELIRKREEGGRQPISPVAGFMLEAQRALLMEFQRAGSTRAITTAIELLRIADYATAMSALQYLLAVGTNDAQARAAAEAASDPGSSLADDPLTASLIKALGEAPQKEKE